MRGHGTYIEGDRLVASVAGKVERVNKLISVKPAIVQFSGEIGDVVVGRIVELLQKKWKVDIKGKQVANLMLTSINLPGVQRRKTESDELEMRSFFAEGDVLSAEIHRFFEDGSCSLQARNIKYGKLRNGSLVDIPSVLVKRSKSHFLTLACGVDVVLGLNGYIWVSKHTKPDVNNPDALYSNENEEISIGDRETIARVSNIIRALADQKCFIDETMIAFMLEAAQDYKTTDLLKEDVQKELVEMVQRKVEMM